MLNDLSERFEGYRVGALLYSPANSDKIIRQIAESRIAPPYSVALCLEDAISDDSVAYAEEMLLRTLGRLKKLSDAGGVYVPDIFIRVRDSFQPLDLIRRAGRNSCMIKGFIFPKYTVSNAAEYNSSIVSAGELAGRKVYMMPIFESEDIISIATRRSVLTELKGMTDSVRDYILNIRTGGNDFCNCFGLRRSVTQTIYDISIVRDCITDILNLFLRDYIISAPVWEYFGDGEGAWRSGMEMEAELDRLNGFIGKTVIHPVQVPVVNSALRVSAQDHNDAVQILNWSRSSSGVEKGAVSGRMNEVKCHTRWAERTLALAKIFGIKEAEA